MTEDRKNSRMIEEDTLIFGGKVYRKDSLPPRLRSLLEKYLRKDSSLNATGSWSSDWSDWSDHSDTGKEIVSNVLHKTLQDILPGRNPSMYPTTHPVVCDHDLD